MDDINLGTTIARLRKAEGLTQSALADHLGVTKAAVSKWELGQSLPDMAQLPRIAAYFSVTIDELFDYRPQMSEERLKRLAAELSRVLLDSPEAAIGECRRYIKDYYSCWPLVAKLSHLMYTAAVHANPMEPDQAVIDEAVGYFEHIAKHADDIELVRSAKFVIAGMAMAAKRYEEAIERFEELKPAQPLEIEASLAASYQLIGETEKAIAISQEHLLWSVLGAMNSCISLVSLCDNDACRLEALVRAAEATIESFGLSELNPSFDVSLRLGAASAYKRMGDIESAYGQLELFANHAARADEMFSIDKKPGMMFDRLGPLLCPDAEDADRAYLENTMSGLGKLGLLQMLEYDPEWADMQKDARFQAIVSALRDS